MRIRVCLWICVVFAACAPPSSDPEQSGEEPYLFVWTTDSDSVDLNFLAVVDALPSSPTYGEVLNTLPVPTEGRTRGHHTEHRMPEGGFLFANDFGTGKTYIFDLRDASSPSVADSFATAGPLTSPHSFERLPNGNVLATLQNEGLGNSAPGGIAEIDRSGAVVRWTRAAAGDRYIRPYSLAVAPAMDRVVTGSADMRDAGDSRVIQVWRLHDLSLLGTIDLPEEWGAAAEPRVLDDGETVLVSTFRCKLLRVGDLGDETPSVSLVYDFGGDACALPVVVGNLWIQTVPDIHGLVALDVSDPNEPVEVSRVVLADDDWPHWISLEPGGGRIVVTGYAGTRYRILMLDLEQGAGRMSVDSAFTMPNATRPGISFNRADWPHGSTGPGDPHGVVFSRSTERPTGGAF